jgi:hypothetical protein
MIEKKPRINMRQAPRRLMVSFLLVVVIFLYISLYPVCLSNILHDL